VAGISSDKGRLEYIQLDLGDLVSVKRCANELLQRNISINILVNNAGVMMPPFSKTPQGFELQFGTNHLGHFLLTQLLLENIVKCNGRIVNVSSMAHSFAHPAFTIEELKTVTTKTYRPKRWYGVSKKCNLLFTHGLQNRFTDFPKSEAVAYSVHPGVICTEVGRWIVTLSGWVWWLFGKSIAKTPKSGAQTTLYASVAPKNWLVPGGFYQECTHLAYSLTEKEKILSKELWQFSLEAVREFL